jgi:hypothetical protein
MPKKLWDDRCGRPEIHQILLSGLETRREAVAAARRQGRSGSQLR